MQTEKSEKTVSVCMLDLFPIPRSVKKTCFSDQQIEMLFRLFKEFMLEKFQFSEPLAQARAEVEQLYSTATSVENKYNALRLFHTPHFKNDLPALQLDELSWVMSDASPTPFIAFLRKRPEVMVELRMSFKPRLLHSGPLETQDFVELLTRYVYWFQNDRSRSLNVMGINTDVNTMITSMKNNWTNARFHLAMFREDARWVCVLVDVVSNTFEYYDPMEIDINIVEATTTLADNIKQLYLSARLQNSFMVSKTTSTTKRGFRSKEQTVNECGMYVILFVHSRVVENRSFEQFTETGISAKDCRTLKDAFFDIPSLPNRESTNKDYRLKFGEYTMRLAALELIRYISHLTSILADQNDRFTLNKFQTKLTEMIVSKDSYAEIRAEGIRIQKEMMAMLPEHFREYMGTDIWSSIIQEINQDPLTLHLRGDDSQVRSKKKVRKTEALTMYGKLTEFSNRLGVPKELKEQFELFTRQSIDNYYVPILRFSDDNKERFHAGMFARDFLKVCMDRQDTVSFGVHFMREVRNFIVNSLKIIDKTDLTTRFPAKSRVVMPVSSANIDEVRVKINHCEKVIQRAYEILKMTFSEQITTIPPKRGLDLPPTVAQSIEVQPRVLEIIATQVKAGLENQTFLSNGIQPWEFPMDQSKLPKQLPPQFNLYSLNKADIRRLLNDSKFMTFYAIELMIVSHFIAMNNFGGSEQEFLMNTTIVLNSVVQFLLAAEIGSEHRKIMCTILHRLSNSITHARKLYGLSEEFDNLLRMATLYHNQCVNDNDVNEKTTFFQNVNATYIQIKNKQ